MILKLASLIRIIADDGSNDDYEDNQEIGNPADLISRPPDPDSNIIIEELKYIEYMLELLKISFIERQSDVINPGPGIDDDTGPDDD